MASTCLESLAQSLILESSVFLSPAVGIIGAEPQSFCPLGSSDPLTQASAIAEAIEQLADQLTPSVIRSARADQQGRADLDRIEYALGTIGKALILTDYAIDQEKDIDKLQAFRAVSYTHLTLPTKA